MNSTPQHIQDKVTASGGLNPFGEPLFRIVLGAERLAMCFGEWKKFDNSGNETGTTVEARMCMKYPGTASKYVLEMWTPPENYGTPEAFYEATERVIDGKKTQLLGEYPHRGEYECIKVLETPKGIPVPLTDAIVSALLDVAKRNRELPTNIRIKAAQDAREKEEKEKSARLLEKLVDMERPWWAQNPKNSGDTPHVSGIHIPTSKELDEVTKGRLICG
jgi:hypothetical protein